MKAKSLPSKIILFFILIFSVMLLSGCGAIDYRRIYVPDNNGEGVSVIDDILVCLDKDTYSNAQSQMLYAYVKADVNELELSKTAWVEENFRGEYYEGVNLYDYFNSGISIKTTELLETDSQYYFNIVFQFKSTQHFVYFYGLATPEVIERNGFIDFGEVSKFKFDDFGPFLEEIANGDYDLVGVNPFLNVYEWSSTDFYTKFQSQTRFNDETYVDYYVDKVNSVLSSDYTKEEILSNIEIGQYFETSDTRFSSNADSLIYDADLNMFMHYWDIDGDDVVLKIYRNSPVTYMWYIFALGVSLICVGVMFVIYKCKKKKGGQENE